jgi:hypothetical protein
MVYYTETVKVISGGAIRGRRVNLRNEFDAAGNRHPGFCTSFPLSSYILLSFGSVLRAINDTPTCTAFQA